jgi:hypothetical protein
MDHFKRKSQNEKKSKVEVDSDQEDQFVQDFLNNLQEITGLNNGFEHEMDSDNPIIEPELPAKLSEIESITDFMPELKQYQEAKQKTKILT